MRDILVGILIILGVFLLVDLLYSNNHVCKVEFGQTAKCGIIKNELDVDIKLFNRYW